MNIQNINKNDIHLEFITTQNHIIAYNNKIGEIAIHDVSLKNGDVITVVIKHEFQKRINNAMSYIV